MGLGVLPIGLRHQDMNQDIVKSLDTPLDPYRMTPMRRQLTLFSKARIEYRW
jgi:hypothetical protein